MVEIAPLGIRAVVSIDVSGEGIYWHQVGNADCREGWCLGIDGNGWPYPCKCGGLIHADFGDENASGDYWIHRKCDRCGDNWKMDDLAQRILGTDSLPRPEPSP